MIINQFYRIWAVSIKSAPAEFKAHSTLVERYEACMVLGLVRYEACMVPGLVQYEACMVPGLVRYEACMVLGLVRYKACMVLGTVGDALGYKGGQWEFNEVGKHIHIELDDLGGLSKITISKENGFPLSDDSILHIHIAKALLSKWNTLDEL